MQLVRERHRLSRLIAYPGVFRGEIIGYADAHAESNEHDSDGYLEGEPVGPTRKKVTHKTMVRGGL
jgi:hypothetical protein